jgi:DNA replication protein DnaC
MERSQLFDLMGELKLYGMKAAFDEIMATAVKRQHEPQRIVGDLLNAEINEKQARSIKYQLTIAKLPLAKDLDDFQFEGTPINETLLRALAGGGFIAQQRNAVLVGGTGTGKTHLAIAIARSCIRAGSRGRFYNVVDLVNRLEIETRTEGKVGSPINSLEWTSSFSTNSAICRSLNPEGNSYSTSSVASTSAPQSSSLQTSHSANGRAYSVIPR